MGDAIFIIKYGVPRITRTSMAERGGSGAGFYNCHTLSSLLIYNFPEDIPGQVILVVTISQSEKGKEIMKGYAWVAAVLFFLSGTVSVRAETCDGTPEYRASVERSYRNIDPTAITLKTDFLRGGYTYPLYIGGSEKQEIKPKGGDSK